MSKQNRCFLRAHLPAKPHARARRRPAWLGAHRQAKPRQAEPKSSFISCDMARKGWSTATRSMPSDTADIAVLKLPSNLHQAQQAMLYIFEVLGTEYLKMGYTAICPWRRIRWGFCELKHPKVCCGSLGWDDLQLLVLSYGRVEDEKYIQKQVN